MNIENIRNAPDFEDAEEVESTRNSSSLSLPRLVTAGSLLERRPEPMDYVIEDLLPKGKVGMLVGPGGVVSQFLRYRLLSRSRPTSSLRGALGHWRKWHRVCAVYRC